MPRIVTESRRKKSRHVNVPDPQWAALGRLALKRDTTVSALVRLAIDEFLARQK